MPFTFNASRLFAVVLLASGASFAQQVNLTASTSALTLPDGFTVPMWGYSCGAAATAPATCAPLNPNAPAGTWSPVLITVPPGGLTISLTNNLPASVPETSLTIVGQVGGGLGDVTQRTTTPSPTHAEQQTTWFAAAAGPTNVPPPQGARVQSFATPVAPGNTVQLTWSNLRPGTYLIESGTHPSIQGPMGLYGILVVTTPPASGLAGCAYPGAAAGSCAVSYNGEIPVLLSEIDPIQNDAVAAAVNAPYFSETLVWSGQPGGCGNPGYVVSASTPACYPPAVNYTPLYYLVNGVAFNNKSSATSAFASMFSPLPSGATNPLTGSVLVRFVNAGLRMHVPSIVGSVTTPAVVAPGVTRTAVAGFSLVAEDGNPLPGVSRVQSEVFLAAGKTHDVMIDVPAAGGTALPVFDRELSLSANSIARDAGMLAYLSINGADLPAAAKSAYSSVKANDDVYNSVIPGHTLIVSDPAKGVLANDVNVYGVQVVGAAPAGLTLHSDGTFVYAGGVAGATFTYCGNGTTSGAACANVTLGAAPMEAAGNISCGDSTFTSNVSTTLSIKPPGILANCKDGAGYPLTVDVASVTPTGFASLSVDPNGGFNATVAAPGSYSFTFKAQNSQGTDAQSAATVHVTFPSASGLHVQLVDGTSKANLTDGNFGTGDFRWIIEEDRTFYINPACTTNPPAAGCPTAGGIVPTLGTNFHTSYMPVVAAGCTGPLSCESGQTLLGQPAVCDSGNGVCRTTATQQAALDPATVHLDPTRRYYISVLPGDAANSFENANDCLSNPTPSCGHGMGGAPITCTPASGQVVCTATSGAFPSTVKVLVQPNPFPPAKLSIFVFEDDFPLNGEQDSGGGIDVLAPNEPGLGGFNITLFDDAGGTGDATGQMTYDMFNMPLSNGLAGTIDPNTGLDACPISGSNVRKGFDGTPSDTGITGAIVTCPKYEADGKTLSPLAGQVVVSNLMPGRYGVVATPGADRIARGEEWLQTNTLDGQKAHDSFLRIGEPSFFQEYGPAGYHVSIGFANPAIINGRKKYVCNGTDPNVTGDHCTNSVTAVVTTERMSRTPDERLYSSGDNSSFAFTQCYASLGDPDGEDFAFAKCDENGRFTLSGLPDGTWRITVFDQWNDMLVDGLSTPVALNHNVNGGAVDLGQLAMNQWQANLYTKSFLDLNGNGIQDGNEPGLSLVSTNIRFRDGSYSNFNNTDLAGNAGFNEIFPLFNWYVVEGYSTRYKTTGAHVVYDSGGPADGTPCGSTATPPTAPCGNSGIGANLANTAEQIPLPANLRVPGAKYCANADCLPGDSFAGGSTGRLDPPFWFGTYGWQGFSGQNNFIEFAKRPYAVGETGGIFGEVIYASTRPFDDPTLLLHTSWTPDVPGVTINLYQEGTAPDGSVSLTLVDTTRTSSWDDWAQGFRSDGVPNMNCPGQGAATGTNADLFFYSLYNQPEWLDMYGHGGTPSRALPNNAQFKCYDGMHNWNQIQPAPYDGMYSFPSVTALDPATGKPAGTNCTACVPNPDSSDPYRYRTPMLPAGKYVVEMIVPPGYELVKEEDKNILIGDNYIAPVTQQFAGLGNIFIMPDQAEVSAQYNANNAQNPTNALGRTTFPTSEGDTGSVEVFWPCVGAARVVPDYISLFPQSAEVAPFAGAVRNLCDRKEVVVNDQSAALAKFWVFSSTHVAAHYTGIITDDFTSEFDPFSPAFGEKFSPPNMPISFKDWTGTEIARTYSDQWGAFDGLNYSTWEVNPPNPTGYAPTMMITCMNDPGTAPTPDPLFNPQYSQFCYEIPFMPGQTQYMDTPVIPTSAFAGAGYNNPDCAYPATTPAIAEVDGDGVGPWVSAAGKTLTITALGDQLVPNNAYSGPSASTAPYNQKKVLRHYGFGTQCTSPTSSSQTCNTLSSVMIDGKNATITSWSDTSITVTVPSGVTNCPIQQQGQATAQCGELVITAGNGKQSVDTVTVTIGGKSPTHVAASDSIQAAIDAAQPGDLIMVDPGVHQEMLLMWKPVRLQGVGAASSVINGNAHPAGKVDDWRKRVTCLFGLGTDGSPGSWDPACGSGWTSFVATANNPQIDRLPLEATVGWDANLNGNLAELLQEPSLMGALEGAGITVLSKGVDFHGGNPFDPTLFAGFPTGTTLLTANTCSPGHPSSFWCNPSSIDGLSITNSSQGGGGIFVHGWGHNIQIANNRIYNNAGTLGGGINVGQGEFPPGYFVGNIANAAPGSCMSSSTNNLQLPYCHDLNVNMHNNYVALNSSTGDELFSATPAGAGGVSICTGSDFYKFNSNWVCGNLSTGDGGGVAHIGFSYGGDIEHNTILFNQSSNPTIPANGGGLLVMGSPDVDPACGAQTDADCVPPANSVGPSDGVGPGLLINANLILGNAADSGSGGGLRLQAINGTDVVNFANGNGSVTFPGISGSRSPWYGATVTNNIIVNNVAGWDGAGISLLDALNVDIVNNTIISNDSTASAGVLFNTIGAPSASASGTDCIQNGSGGTRSCPQPAGLVSVQNSAILTANLPNPITCPARHFAGTSANNGSCRRVSYPELYNDVFWQNRSFYIGVGTLGTGTQNQQNVVALYNAFTSPPARAPSQTSTGACPTASYWDIGVRGDTGPTNHSSNVTLTPQASILTSINGYAGGGTGFRGNSASNPAVVSQYCNGSRVPPELGASGYQVPPGISDATVPNPIFHLTPSATVDEGNNWINMSWGPLSLRNPSDTATLGNYTLTSGSPAINYITQSNSSTTYAAAPALDFFNNLRKANNAVDIGAVEFSAPPNGSTFVAGGPLNFGSVNVGSSSTAQTLTLTNTSNTSVTGIALAFSPAFSRSDGSCTTTLAGGASCTIGVVFTPAAGGAVSGTLTITASVPIAGSPVTLTGTGIPPITVAGGPLNFGTVTLNTTSTAQTLTLTNPANGASVTGINLAFSPGVFSRASSGGTCGTTLAAGSSCTINVVFRPTTAGTVTGSLTITASVGVTGSPVTLTGTGGSVGTVSLSPGTWSATANRGVTNAGPTLQFALRNTGVTGSPTVTGIGQITLTGPNAADWVISAGLTSCGSTVTSLAPGVACQIGVQFRPLNTEPSNSLSATLSVSDSAGTQTSALTGTANGAGLISISPNTGAQGTTVAVTLNGTNLTVATAVNAGTGVNCTIGTKTASSLTASCVIAGGTTPAPTGAHSVTVSYSGGTSNAVTFTVTSAPLALAPASTASQGLR